MKRWFIGILLGAIPWLAAAQVLDFDSVCAAPPCAIGSLYAPSGVTFTPNSTPIVAGGTNGLTGPVGGGRYLSVQAFPYDVTITLARQATFFSMQLSRASTSSGPVTVTITWLKAGAPVNNINVVLSNVNTWSTASASVAGGFDAIVLDPSGGANLTFGIDGVQLGGTCNGFGDVQPSDSFCNASEWLANRGVTLGCAQGQYCPSQNVTRAQMSLFMQRLGDAAAPVHFRTTGSANGAFSGALTASPTCISPLIPATPYRREAVVLGTAILFATAAPKLYSAKVVTSNDNAVTWAESAGFFMSAHTQTGGHVVLAENAVVPMAAGVAYRFALGFTSGSATAGSLECEVIVQVNNAGSGGSAPFDAADEDVQQQQR